MKIAVIGSINMDIVMKVPRLPQKGETLTAEETHTIPGGKGANQAVAAARLGNQVSMVGALGRDAFGETLLEGLKKNHLDTRGILRTDAPSGTAMITVDPAGDNTILVYPGANGQVTPAWIRQQQSVISEAEWVMLQLEIPMDSVLEAARMAREMGIKVLLNPAPAVELPEELISLVDMLTPNETELALLSRAEGIEQGAEVMLSKGVETVVVTLGANGSMAKTRDSMVSAAAFPIQAVDTTAAGDAFNAALVTALGEGKELGEALSFANATGALTATRMGAQTSLPTRDMVEEFLRKSSN